MWNAPRSEKHTCREDGNDELCWRSQKSPKPARRFIFAIGLCDFSITESHLCSLASPHPNLNPEPSNSSYYFGIPPVQ
ncbi:hypothetical protein CL673_00370 [Candidatus Bathyarchaeota archaeon]|nr:hypothetical protein [Candidatus Bathyarchaeota archaeon]